VDHVWLTLEGEVDWYFQKEAALQAVEHLTGVRGVSNRLSVLPTVTAPQIRDRIEAAFRRAADLDAGRIEVEIQGPKVVLRGSVRSRAEYDAAEWAAWSAPGVVQVENRMTFGDGPELPPAPLPAG
jgi:osmotically-inducible protein OsmY